MIETAEEAKQFGEEQADVIIEFGHLTYNASRGKRIVAVCIEILQDGMESNPDQEKTRIETFARKAANVVIRTGSMTLDVSVGRKIIDSCIKRIEERINEIQPKKADSKYKKARYGK